MSAIAALEIRELGKIIESFFEKEYLNKVYPIGSIYISAVYTDPATLFGGQWQKIEDRFLLAEGYESRVGETGGSLTHSHSITVQTSALSQGQLVSVATGGETSSESNIPPFLSVCMWKRIA